MHDIREIHRSIMAKKTMPASVERAIEEKEDIEEVCVIDCDFRTITIPEKLEIAGVMGDNNTKRIFFKCHKLAQLTDLSRFNFCINYLNANGEADRYHCKDVEVSGEYLTFSWLVSDFATKYKGKIMFVVCAMNNSTGEHWNSTISSINVLEGLETTSAIIEQNPDIFEEILQEMSDIRVIGENVERQAQETKKNAESAKTGATKAEEKANKAQEYALVAEREADRAEQATDGKAELSDIEKIAVKETTEKAESLYIENSADFKVVGIDLFGKTEQSQEPQPSPEYKQEIKAIGNNVKLIKGGYSANGGQFVDNELPQGTLYYYTDKNKTYFPCNSNDVVKLLGEGFDEKNIYFYRSDKTYIRYISAKEPVIIPEECAFFRIDVKKVTTIYPDYQSLGNIDVLINDKYAVKVKTTGKNLFDINSKEKNNGNATNEVYGETIKVISNGKGSPTTFYNLGDTKDYIGKTLYLKCDEIIKSKPNMFPKIIIKSTKNNQTSVKDILICDMAGQEVTVKVPSDLGEANTISLCVYATLSVAYETGNYAIFKNIMLSEKSIEDYQKYKESVAFIPLDYPLYEGDKLYLEDGELWEYRENQMFTFDGSADEDWVYEGKNMYILIDKKNKGQNGKDKNVICDKIPSNEKQWVSNSTIFSVMLDSGGEAIYISNLALCSNEEISNITSADEWKNWLKSNPIETVCKLKEPIRKKAGTEAQKAIRQLKTFYPITHVTNSENAEMQVKYVADTKLYIDNLFTEIANQMLERRV